MDIQGLILSEVAIIQERDSNKSPKTEGDDYKLQSSSPTLTMVLMSKILFSFHVIIHPWWVTVRTRWGCGVQSIRQSKSHIIRGLASNPSGHLNKCL